MNRRYDDERDDRRHYRSGDWDRGEERNWGGHGERRNDRSRDEGWMERAGDRLESWGERVGNRVSGWFDDDDRGNRGRNERQDQRGGWDRQHDDRSRGDMRNDPRDREPRRENVDRNRGDMRGNPRERDAGRENADRERDWNRPYRREYDMGERHLDGGGFSDRWRSDRDRYDVDNRRWDRGRESMDAGNRRDREEDRRPDERGNRGYGRYNYDQRGGDERSFMERAGDEVRSWFGDDESERRRHMDERQSRADERTRGRGEGNSRSGGMHDESWW